MASEEVSKLNSYGVLLNQSLWTSKLNAYAVLGPLVPVDLAGNLGGSSQYGALLWGKGQYSRVSAFAPAFAADITVAAPNPVPVSGDLAPIVSFAATGLDITTPTGNLNGDLALQIALGGLLNFDGVLRGALPVMPVLGASLDVGPLWGASEPCPASPWAPSEPCQPSMWTPIGPCDSVVWKKAELSYG